jgi:hypothetical protein
MWVWMKPQIEFCTIGKCDILSYFISIESLPATCKSHPLFFLLLKHGDFQMGFHLFCFSILAHFYFLFLLFFKDPSICWGEIPLIGIFCENHLVNRIKVGTRNDKGLIWSLWNAWQIMPSSIRIGHYQA